MRIVKLKKENLMPFLEGISEGAELFAPVRKYPDRFVFSRVEDFARIDLNYTRTIIPPRKIILPPSLRMFAVDGNRFEEDFSHVTKKILFGIHPCDINGILILDQFFRQPFNDPYYSEARKNTLILGHSCWPDEYCMCLSTRTHIVQEGYDLFFSALDDDYLVWIGSSQGDDLIRLKPKLFEEKHERTYIHRFIEWREERDKAFMAKLNFNALPDLMELKYDDPLWEKLGEACLACGSCSNVCPTCNCYNVYDHPWLEKKGSDIKRCWDACTLQNYSEVAGGENFREKRSERLKLWYTHKLQAYISKYGKPACVGCARCVATCPVDINVKTVAQALEDDPVDAFWNRMGREANQ